MHDLSRRIVLKSTAAALGAFGLGAGPGSSNALAAGKIKPAASAALIVVDVQNCFVEGGTLPVGKGAEVVPVINKLASAFENIVVTQDWHTPGCHTIVSWSQTAFCQRGCWQTRHGQGCASPA